MLERVVLVAEAGRMPLFMSDDEFANESGDVQAVVARADAFIGNLQDQLEVQKVACADLEQKLHKVVLFCPGHHLWF